MPSVESAFRVGFVPGVMPDKWRRLWGERRRRTLELVLVDPAQQESMLRSGKLHMCLVRGTVDRDVLHLIPLYVEESVIVVSKDHPAAAYDELAVGELADDVDVFASFPDLSMRDAISTVAAGTGYLVLPRSVARVNQLKDITVVRALEAPESPVGLAWLINDDSVDPDIETFVGIVRGRTVRSSR